MRGSPKIRMPTVIVSTLNHALCTCLLWIDWVLSRPYNEAFGATCLATFFMLSSYFGCALIFARVTRALCSESCWHHDRLHLPVSATPNGRKRMRRRNGRRNGRKRRKEEEME